MRLVLALAVTLTACTQPRSKRCQDVCTAEYDCVTKTNSTLPFDERECVAACSALEQDPDHLAKVQKHFDCVTKKEPTCPALLDCE